MIQKPIPAPLTKALKESLRQKKNKMIKQITETEEQSTEIAEKWMLNILTEFKAFTIKKAPKEGWEYSMKVGENGKPQNTYTIVNPSDTVYA